MSPGSQPQEGLGRLLDRYGHYRPLSKAISARALDNLPACAMDAAIKSVLDQLEAEEDAA